MATLLLRSAGAAVGGLVGGPMGAGIGATIAGTLARSSKLPFGPTRTIEGPRLTGLAGLTSSEGAPIPRVYGRARTGGELIWTTRFEESVTLTRSGSSGGKGFGTTTRHADYSYFANLAVALCDGPIAQVRRIWADGREIDQTLCTIRVHTGGEDQPPDPLIVAKEGAENAPAYRGLAYVVFERLPLAGFGNRIPQLSFEVVRAIDPLGAAIRAVNIIPGAGEYAYAPQSILSAPDVGVTVGENRHQLIAVSDWVASIDALEALCPRLASAALVVSWFGDDLRAGQCTIEPRVESTTKIVPTGWSVAGYTRATTRRVSLHDGGPAFGGTPSDDSVRAAIADLKARGLAVTIYPFVMMDIPVGNAAGQPAYPWRGRITCAPGADATAAGRAEVEAFFARYRPMLLHYAQLCRDAGGVEAFLLGSELVGLTRLRDEADIYPAARALASLAREVRAILGAGVKIGYAADWTEYGAQARNGGADLDFPLDALWACEAVDFIGIDAYFPLSDWRDGSTHLDAAHATSIYDRDYLLNGVTSGEDFDWFYATDAARRAQQRTPITDGAYAKPWCFRAKDLKSWWSNPHVERRNGVERARATAYVPMAKPIRLVEIGCPAVDRGANGPNVFVDAKSSESALPPFSRGFRDDLMQARALAAMIAHYGDDPQRNPRSPVYGGPMVDPAHVHVWAWDARPFPAFPNQSGVWADAANWETGHWLNGRLEGCAMDALVRAICRDLLPDEPLPDTSAILGHVEGYALDRPLSARAALEPLATLFGFEAVLAGAALRFVGTSGKVVARLSRDDLVPDADGALVRFHRAPDGDLAQELALGFSDGDVDYRIASVTARRAAATHHRKLALDCAAVLSRAAARRLCDVALGDAWCARNTVSFSLRPSLVALEAGDFVQLDVDGVPPLLRITRLVDGAGRLVEARAVAPALHETVMHALPRPRVTPPAVAGPPHVEVLDLAIARDDNAVLQHVAVFADPWPGPMMLWKREGASDFADQRAITRPAVIGTLLDDLGPAPTGLYDRRNSVRVRVGGGTLSSVEDAQLLAGRNLAALRGPDGAWEIIAFARADLVATQTWQLSKLLRGLGGESLLAGRTLAAGARFVLLDEAVVPLASGVSALGVTATYRIGPAARGFGDAAVTEFVATPGNKALLPYAPLRASARRTAQGVAFSFIRRSRREADGWEAQDIPLGETSELYRITVLRGGASLRVLTGTSTTILYAAVDEFADFGSAQARHDIIVQQVSASAGAGLPLRASLSVL